jgi:integrase
MKETFERVGEHLYKRQYQTAGGDWRTKYYAIFTDWKGKRRKFSLGTDEKAARQGLTIRLADNLKKVDFDKERDDRNARQLTFSKWADRCLEADRERTKRTDSEALAVSSWERDSRSCDHLRRFFGDLPLTDITSQKIEAYITARTLEGIIRGGSQSKTIKVSRSTVANELATLRKYLRRAVPEWLQVMPAMKLPKKGERNRVLNPDEYQRLIAAAPIWFRRVLIVAFETCLSQGDLLRLTDDMIDEKAGVIVPRDGRIKTGVEQVSPLTPTAREVVKEIRSERGKVQNLTSRQVFTKNGRPVNKTMIENAMVSTLKRAKIENFCFHDLRHCAKTSWARRGIPAEVAMKAAGHKSWQMHARYIHIQKTDVASVFNCSQGFPKESSTVDSVAVSS